MITKSKAELIDEWIENAKGMISASAARSEYEAVLKNDTVDVGEFLLRRWLSSKLSTPVIVL
jgi:hypothetical protein